MIQQMKGHNVEKLANGGGSVNVSADILSLSALDRLPRKTV